MQVKHTVWGTINKKCFFIDWSEEVIGNKTVSAGIEKGYVQTFYNTVFPAVQKLCSTLCLFTILTIRYHSI